MKQKSHDAADPSHMLRMIREKIAEIEAGRYLLRFDEIPGSTTITYTVGFALNRFEEMGSTRSTHAAFDTLDAEQIRVCQIIRRERGLPPLQYRQSHHLHGFGYSGGQHGGK